MGVKSKTAVDQSSVQFHPVQYPLVIVLVHHEAGIEWKASVHGLGLGNMYLYQEPCHLIGC